jgi:hypothetical protein
VPGIGSDLPETISPIVAAAREDLHRFVGEVDLDTIAVELISWIHSSPEGTRSIEVASAGAMNPGGLDPRRFRLFSLEGHRFNQAKGELLQVLRGNMLA